MPDHATVDPVTRPVSEPRGTNVTPLERWLSGLAGALAVGYGLQRPTLAGLGSTLLGADLLHRAVTGNCTLYKLYDFTLPRRDTPVGERVPHGIAFETSVIIHRPVKAIFPYFRRAEQLPIFSGYDTDVDGEGMRRYEGISDVFRSRGDWEANIIDQQADRFVTWYAHSARGKEAGAVTFIPLDRNTTELHLKISYHPPGGRPTATLARLRGADPRQRIREALLEFKYWMESGAPGTPPPRQSSRVH